MPYLVDSDVLIDISRGKPAAREYVDALTEPWVISQISALELIVGARDKKELADIDTFLSAYPVAPLRNATGEKAYELLKLYAKTQGLHVFDSLVAATAIDQGLTLVTRNRKHFSGIKDLDLQIPDY